MPPKVESSAPSLTRRSRNPSPPSEMAPGPEQDLRPDARPARIPRRDATLRGHEGLPRARPDAPPSRWVAPPPRTSLCARATRWLALLTGLGAIGLHLHRLTRETTQRPVEAPVPPPPSTARPPDRSDASGTLAEAAWVDSHPDEDVPRILQDSHADLFEAFRDSPDSREPRKLEAFMRAMVRAIRRDPASVDAHLPTLLRVWRWTYGETFRAADGRELNVGALMTSSIVPPVVTELGGPHMSLAHLEQLVSTVCREPENIPPTLQDPAVLATHARWSATALTQVIRLTTPSSSGTSMKQRQEAEEAQLRRCLEMVLGMPAFDGRWVPLVVQSLQAQGPAAPLGLVIAPDRWEQVISQAFLRHTVATTQGVREEHRPSTARARARA